MSDRMDPVERKVIAIALSVSFVHLLLIAFAAIKLGISVPSCVTAVTPFDRGALIDNGVDPASNLHRYELHIVARMWGFEPSAITLPANSLVDIFLVSVDVNHGFNIQDTNVNLMAVPGAVNYAQVHFLTPGTHPIVCHEYCGTGHQSMRGSIQIVENLVQASAEGLRQESDMPGKKHYIAKGCMACHSTDGTASVGPTFRGLFGKTEKFTDGTELVVDAAYMKTHIEEPGKKIVLGYPPVMPKLPISPQEVQEIIEYIQTLK